MARTSHARAIHERTNLLARAWTAQTGDVRAANHIQTTSKTHPFIHARPLPDDCFDWFGA
eukprot:1301544-Lingulodinium_polyedra.AAC.1